MFAKLELTSTEILISIHLFGAVAQLGERLHGMQEVVSSTLIGSIVIKWDDWLRHINICIILEGGNEKYAKSA